MPPAVVEFRKKFGDNPVNVLSLFNPDNQNKYCRDVERCFFGSAPTIGVMKSAYGNQVAESWLEIQLKNLSDFAGCRDKITPLQITELASMMLEYYGHYKLTEFMLFFQKFKKCEYGKFYGAVDPMVIMGALDTFNRDRLTAYYKRENELEKERKRKEEKEYEELRRRYKERVPDAFTDKAPINFSQYRTLGYDDWDDIAFHNELQDIINGIVILPKEYPTLIDYAKQRKGLIKANNKEKSSN